MLDTPTQNIDQPTVSANDFLGRLIEVGHTIVYPTRRGSKMWMQKTCPACRRRKIRRDFTSAPAIHHHYSPMHPRRNRGRGY